MPGARNEPFIRYADGIFSNDGAERRLYEEKRNRMGRSWRFYGTRVEGIRSYYWHSEKNEVEASGIKSMINDANLSCV
jgi:hypothetical protein